ncbi:MAG: hypothetical protein KDB90_13775 [Planctomycetes bacterium]|nr:hypothetical protein [Planctomycetota bacterium]
MTPTPSIILPEQAANHSAGGRRTWVLIVVLVAAALGSCVAGLFILGKDVYLRDRVSVRAWSNSAKPSRQTGVAVATVPAWDWYAVVDRRTRTNLTFRRRRDYSLGMVLVVLPPMTPTGAYSHAQQEWTMQLPGSDSARVTRDVVQVAGTTFYAAGGRLVLVDADGRARQFPFKSEVRSEQQLESEIARFLHTSGVH